MNKLKVSPLKRLASLFMASDDLIENDKNVMSFRRGLLFLMEGVEGKLLKFLAPLHTCTYTKWFCKERIKFCVQMKFSYFHV